jgi:hypothetical protein
MIFPDSTAYVTSAGTWHGLESCPPSYDRKMKAAKAHDNFKPCKDCVSKATIRRLDRYGGE